MTESTKITTEKLEEIRQRYRPTEVPKCHICGAEMTIQRMSASRITYGCAGAIYDETGCHYAEGRSLADDHYAESRITVVDVSDPDVLALVEAHQSLAELSEGKVGNALLERENHHVDVVGKLIERIAELEESNAQIIQSRDHYKRMTEEGLKRLAKSRTVTVKLPDDEDGQAYGFGKWANGKLPATAGTMTIAYCEDAWRAAFEVFSSAAGIKVEGD